MEAAVSPDGTELVGVAPFERAAAAKHDWLLDTSGELGCAAERKRQVGSEQVVEPGVVLRHGFVFEPVDLIGESSHASRRL